MSPRKHVRFSDSVTYLGRTKASKNNYQSSNNKKTSSGDLILPLQTLQLLMRKCQVKLRRCDDNHHNTGISFDKQCKRVVVGNGEKQRRRASESDAQSRTKLKKVSEPNYILKQKPVENTACTLSYVKTELDFEKENFEEGNFLDIEATLLIPEVSINKKEEEEREQKYNTNNNNDLLSWLPTCQVKLVRCDGDVKVKTKVELAFEKLVLKPCHVVLYRCDSIPSKIEAKSEDNLVHRKRKGSERRSKIKTPKEPVPCYLCGKMLASKQTMLIHLQSHTGERPYKCRFCDKRFVKKPTLVYHERALHTGERPVSCWKCDQRFYARSSLSAHMKRKHSKRSYFF